MSEQSNYPRPKQVPAGFINCPSCGEPNAKAVSYTWWGGAVGPAILKLAKCKSCKFQFNRNTGESAKKGIIIYNVVVGVITFIAVFGFVLSQGIFKQG